MIDNGSCNESMYRVYNCYWLIDNGSCNESITPIDRLTMVVVCNESISSIDNLTMVVAMSL